MFVARKIEMQLFLIFVMLVFSVALIPYALPIILYIAPLIVVGVLISWVTDSIRNKSRIAGH